MFLAVSTGTWVLTPAAALSIFYQCDHRGSNTAQAQLDCLNDHPKSPISCTTLARFFSRRVSTSASTSFVRDELMHQQTEESSSVSHLKIFCVSRSLWSFTILRARNIVRFGCSSRPI
ncbi:hypothetical protein BDR04DRAFT_1088994 [Suillus decipiens]|nr:hypothetical protein BDR04DRAFT_1088994 [Suillus decipiens]